MSFNRFAALLALAIAVSATWLSCRGTTGSVVSSSAEPSVDATTSSFPDVWQKTKAKPYAQGQLPHETVTLISFGPLLKTFIKDAVRTLTSQSDWLPTFRKLLRPNGYCLAGVWQVTAENPYGGYFAPGTEALIIARASVNFDRTEVGQARSFGMAGKLYPTKDQADANAYTTANFFLIDDNTGTKAESYLDAVLLNEPKATPSLASATLAPTLLASKEGQETAEFKVTGFLGHSGVRQLYPLAGTGRAPAHLRVTGAVTDGFRTHAKDFRDELAPASYPVASGLAFSVAVDGMATEATDESGFTPIATIRFFDGIASEGCDHNLHFAHPKWRAE